MESEDEKIIEGFMETTKDFTPNKDETRLETHEHTL